MMKRTTFFASWRDYEMMHDKQMTRERMALMMRAWRRSKTQGRSDFTLQRISTHFYRVSAPNYPNEWHFVKWETL